MMTHYLNNIYYQSLQRTSAYFSIFSMTLVKKSYGNLQHAISEMGDKVSGVLAKQEGEFLSAYRAHMRNVQTDFRSLREELDEKDRSIANNEKVLQLEKERDWYKKEALHLEKILLKTQKKEHNLNEKVAELEEDLSWHSNQLKNVLKQKNILERQMQ